jgi:hypothetical protein
MNKIPENLTPSLTISQAKITIPSIINSILPNSSFKRIGTVEQKNKLYDKYQIEKDGKQLDFFEDITSFYGRGKIIPNLFELDVPQFDLAYSLKNFLENNFEKLNKVALSRNINLNTIRVVFKPASSDMISNHIATYIQAKNEILVTPFKEYNSLFDYPILHSYNLYKLFILHEVVHLVYGYDFKCIAQIKGDVSETIIGKDCIQFTPLQERTFANEFINYLLWSHKPGAFENKHEILAFVNCVFFGIQSNLFTLKELRESVVYALSDNRETLNLLVNQLIILEKLK